MVSTNFRKKSDKAILKRSWKRIDDACGSLEDAFTTMCSVSKMPSNVGNMSDKLYEQFENIVSLKDEIEVLISKME